MRSYLKISTKYMAKQKRRSFLTVLGVILSVALISSVLLFYSGIIQSNDKIEKENHGVYHVCMQNVKGKFINKISNNVNVGNVVAIKEYGTGYISGVAESDRKYDQEAPKYRKVEIKVYGNIGKNEVKPIQLKKGRLPKKEDEIVLEEAAILYLNKDMKIGDQVTIPVMNPKAKLEKDIDDQENQVENKQENFIEDFKQTFTLVGIKKADYVTSTNYSSEAITYFDIKKVDEYNLYELFIEYKEMKDVKAKTEKIVKNLDMRNDAKSSGIAFDIGYHNNLLKYHGESSNDNANRVYDIFFTIITIIIVISTIAVIYNAFNISVLEKVSQFGILRCIGASPAQISKIVYKEALIISLIGIPIGLAVGIGVIEAIFLILTKFSTLSGTNDGVNQLFVIDYASIKMLIYSGILGIVAIFLSAAGPARLAGKVPPVEAIKSTGLIKMEKIKKSKNIKKKKITRLIFGIEGQLATKNLKRNKKRYRITLFSMIISIVIYIVFAGFANLLDMTGQFDNYEMGEFSISCSANDKISEKLYHDLAKIKGVEVVFKDLIKGSYLGENKGGDTSMSLDKKFIDNKALKFVEKGQIVNGEYKFNVNVLCFGNYGLKHLKKHLLNGDIDVDKMNKENGVLILNSATILQDSKMYKFNPFAIDLGEEIVTTNTKDQKEFKFKNFGAVKQGFSYYTNAARNNKIDNIYLITTEETYKKFVGDEGTKTLSLIFKDKKVLVSAKKEVKKLLKNYPQYTYVDTMDYMKAAKETILFIKFLVYGFIIVIALISAMNIINTISTNLILRTKEFAIFKAIGMEKSGLKKMVFIEALYYGTISTIWGGIIATGVSYLFYRLLNMAMEISYKPPIEHLAIAAVATITISALSGLVPLKRINDAKIMENIRGEE